jgi:hypothetical protein
VSAKEQKKKLKKDKSDERSRKNSLVDLSLAE